ncbi:MAG TPA: carbonic anhydrase family protein [Rhodocyclaceae bacterium]|nr:carbonic anhydrase family protein [Rhodocyclaceae bacterium]
MKLRSAVTSLLLTLAYATSAAEHAPHWGYGGGHGPAKWGDMEADFATCKLGKEQSPIDIRSAQKSALPALDFKYPDSGAEIVNNGHTIQVNLAEGGVLNLDGVPYKLVQFHFHTPSEEKINGKAYPMEAHLVHQSADKNLAVVAVMLKEGKTNAALAPIFKNLPHTEGGKTTLGANFSAAALLPAERGYFKYIGSLTTPPCSEGVRWQVLKQPLEVSKAQIAAFRKLYSMNARPVQPLNGRKLEEN